MNPQITFTYHFYPVGQGLFSTGSLCLKDANEPDFLWVYDCGTLSPQTLLDPSIRKLEHCAGKRNRIDLLVLSHFDRDHISGVCRLLQKFKVGTLMLPYMPLAQRLLIAFEQKIESFGNPLFAFFLNPVEYLSNQEIRGIEYILFVPPSSEAPPVDIEAVPSSPSLGPENGPTIRFVPEEVQDPDEVKSLVDAGKSQSIRIEFTKPGTRITVDEYYWEFVPYNDDPPKVITDAFTDQVAKERANLLMYPSDETRNDSLEKLKNIYKSQFGENSKTCNLISLFLYSGPVFEVKSQCFLVWCKSTTWYPYLARHEWPFPLIHEWNLSRHQREQCLTKCSTLYTGDGYLKSRKKLDKLVRYLNRRRVRDVGVFQVMHHGAKTNWHQGVAGEIAPLFSVFSSDPDRKGWNHPHAEVLRDFWPYGAVQVDKDFDFTVTGILRT